MEAEEEAYETECVILDDCQSANRAGDGDGKDAGAAAGGENEIDGLMVVTWDHLNLFIYMSQHRSLVFPGFYEYLNSLRVSLREDPTKSTTGAARIDVAEENDQDGSIAV